VDAAGSLTTQAVILAGGQGTRLRPLTYERPKPIVPVLNQPFLAYQLALLREHGITDVILACSYRVDDVRAALGDGSALGTHLRYVVEREPLGTGGGVRHAADAARGAVFVLNGDVLTDVDLGTMRRFHHDRRARTTIYVTRVDDVSNYGLVETRADGRVERFREKPGPGEPITSDLINAGIYLIDAELLARIATDRAVSIEREFFPALIDGGIPVYAWQGTSYWRDIGSPAAYLAAQIDLLENRVRTPLAPTGPRVDGTWIAADASIEDGAMIEAPTVIGAGVTIARGSRVGPLAVLGASVRVEAGARISRSVVWEKSEIGAAAQVDGSVVGAGVRIGPGARLEAGTVLESGAVVAARAHLPVRR
jgi:NDP-sugar pyrophosphorylase family protein